MKKNLRDAVERKKQEADEASKKAHAAQLEQGGAPDVSSPRAKSSRHKKTTADKWNQ